MFGFKHLNDFAIHGGYELAICRYDCNPFSHHFFTKNWIWNVCQRDDLTIHWSNNSVTHSLFLFLDKLNSIFISPFLVVSLVCVIFLHNINHNIAIPQYKKAWWYKRRWNATSTLPPCLISSVTCDRYVC